MESKTNQVLELPVLFTKFHIPDVPDDLVPRPDLLNKLNQGMKKGIIIVCAPAGFGKTTLVTEWLKNGGPDASWVTLDEGENDLYRFWVNMIAAMKHIDIDLFQDTAQLFHKDNFPYELIISLINEVSEYTKDFCLILDNYDLVGNPLIHKSIEFLIDYLPPNMKLILISRVVPPLPLHRLRLNDGVCEVDREDLRFRGNDFAVFFKQLQLTECEISNLQTKIEGWPAGMRFALQLMLREKYSAAVIDNFSGKHRLISNFFAEEVFKKQPEEMRTFLLKTSILDRMTGSLCIHITGLSDAHEYLHILVENNLFLEPLDEFEEWYRYHPLFKGFLQKTLLAKYPKEIVELSNRASYWFEREGWIDTAVKHAFSVGDMQKVTDLVRNHAPDVMKRQEFDTLLAWFENFPESWLQKHPDLRIVYAWLLTLSSYWESSHAYLSLAEESVSKGKAVFSEEEQHSFIVEISVIRGYIALLENDPDECIKQMRAAAGVKPFFSRFFRTGMEFILGEPCVVRSNLSLKGTLVETERLYTELRAIWKNSGLPIVGYGSAMLAEIYYEWDEFDKLNYFLKRGLYIGKTNDCLGILVPIFLTYARWKRALKDRKEMWVVVGEVEEAIASSDNNSPWKIAIVAFKTRLNIEEGNLNAVKEWIDTCNVSIDEGFQGKKEFEQITYIRALRALDCPTDALDVTNRLLIGMEREQRLGSIIEIHIIQALIHMELKQVEQAISVLEKTLELAVPERFIRVFLDEGYPMLELFSEFRRSRSLHLDHYHEYCEKLWKLLQQECSGFLEPKKIPTVDPLTKKELEVLSLINSGMSNKDISRKLRISIGTVKGYNHQIYSKLQVKNRMQAIVRAKELNLPT